MSFDMENTLNGYLTKEWESIINSENYSKKYNKTCPT